MRSVCPYCGIDAGTGPNAHANQLLCIQALKEKHGCYQREISRFVMNSLIEVTNEIGGVTGYKLILDPEETEQLCKLIERR